MSTLKQQVDSYIAGMKRGRKAAKRRSNKTKRLVEIAAALALEHERNRNKATTITIRPVAADKRAAGSAANPPPPEPFEAATAEAVSEFNSLVQALVDQQRIANLIALADSPSLSGSYSISVALSSEYGNVRDQIRRGLGL